MGSEKHYPKEAPARGVIIDGFWIDRTSVTNHQFKELVRLTGHKELTTPSSPRATSSLWAANTWLNTWQGNSPHKNKCEDRTSPVLSFR